MKWRELIKKVWEADPLLYPKCQNEMRIVALIDDREVIERILPSACVTTADRPAAFRAVATGRARRTSEDAA